MNRIHVMAGALALAFFAAPATAQIAAPSALEWASGQAQAAPVREARLCRGRACEARAPLDIRTAPQIVAEAARYVGARNPYRFRGPGCKVFVNMVARRAGLYANASARAFDTRGMGVRVSYPQPGDYRVNARRGGGHVVIVARVENGRVIAINGNKGRNRVGWSNYPIAGATYYRPIRTASL